MWCDECVMLLLLLRYPRVRTKWRHSSYIRASYIISKTQGAAAKTIGHPHLLASYLASQPASSIFCVTWRLWRKKNENSVLPNSARPLGCHFALPPPGSAHFPDQRIGGVDATHWKRKTDCAILKYRKEKMDVFFKEGRYYIAIPSDLWSFIFLFSANSLLISSNSCYSVLGACKIALDFDLGH